MANLNGFTFSIPDNNPLPGTSNIDHSLNKICDGLNDIFNTQSSLPIVSNFNSENASINYNALADQIRSDYQQSTTLGPIRSISDFNGIQVPNREQVTYQQINQVLNTKPDVFYIISQPRDSFRPRTEKERANSSHFIRCREGDKYEYLTTNIPQTWNGQNSYIEVSLLDICNNPHPYAIENREPHESSVVFKPKESNKLCFRVTNDDVAKGFKNYKIEFIKSKQDDQITKEVIKDRQLNKSKLRFTRYYQTTDGSYERDESSVIDTIVMTEEYGKFRVEDVFPLHGPVHSHQKVCIETKGPVPNDCKNNFHIYIIINDINGSCKIEEIKKNGNNFTFKMPVLPNVHMNRLEAKINIEYKQNLIYQANYLYISSLDRELSVKTSIESDDRIAVNFSSSDASTTASIMASNSENRSGKRKKM
ncbi:unnamed protein product [Adineta steineri]|uniref:Uncharacterized protein n=1 Tax=Adineta steineri TaxID=433720 RepID=A0A816C5M9_9BILA|nr:unnamed protein product [Adineta steineri]CAF1619067.1 unnamed protein product [Adineta steineri]